MVRVVRRWFSGSLAALRAALARPELRRVQLAWTGSTSGESISTIALGLYAYEAGGATAVGVVALVQMVPSMLFSPVAGVLGDRLRRERVVIGTDIVRTVTMALAAVAAASDAPVAVIYALAAVLAIGSQAFYPAQTALVPLLARSANDVIAASAASSMIRSTTGLAAPAVSGVVLLVADVPVVFALAAAAFALGAGTLLGIGRTDSVRSAPAMAGAVHEVASGFRVAARDRGIALVLGLFAAHGIARGALGVLLVVVPLELLRTGEAGVGFLNAAAGVGGFAGAVATAGLVGRRTLAGPMAAGLAATGAAVVLAGAVRWAAVVVACIAGVGAGFAVVSGVGSTLLVRLSRGDVLSRVLGVLGTVRSASMASGSVLAPVLVAAGGPRLALTATGAILVATAATARAGVRALDKRSEVPEYELRLLQASPVFAPLLPLALERLAARLEPMVIPAGAEVVRQGDPGDSVYLVAEGGFAVEVNGRVLAHRGPCELVGEMALLQNAPRNATVRAVQESRVYRLERSEFLAAVTGHPVSSRQASDLVAARLGQLRRNVLDER
ncbi:MAG: cyclic nucleotide-binding domain-containing protein [Actinomycetota bacterium]|nr:cyclic nucleotide-binding domain-containing protein [Actinomycetota bacterium]